MLHTLIVYLCRSFVDDNLDKTLAYLTCIIILQIHPTWGHDNRGILRSNLHNNKIVCLHKRASAKKYYLACNDCDSFQIKSFKTCQKHLNIHDEKSKEKAFKKFQQLFFIETKKKQLFNFSKKKLKILFLFLFHVINLSLFWRNVTHIVKIRGKLCQNWLTFNVIDQPERAKNV